MMQWMRAGVAAASALWGSAAVGETITFQADDGVVVIRSYDQFGHAVVEFIGEAGAFYQCVALGPSGEPIAASVAMSDIGQVMYEGIRAADISDVKCRRTM